MIIFGWGGGKPRDRGPAVATRCPACENESVHRYYTATKWFTLFFIPVIPYQTKHFLVCPRCMRAGVLTGAALDEVKRAAKGAPAPVPSPGVGTPAPGLPAAPTRPDTDFAG